MKIRLNEKTILISIVVLAIIVSILGSWLFFFRDVDKFPSHTFPSEKNQSLTYSNGIYILKVREKTSSYSHPVFKIHFQREVKPGQPTGSFIFAGTKGRIWEFESAERKYVYDFEKGKIKNMKTGKNMKMADNFMHPSQVFMGSWWQSLNLEPGKKIKMNYGTFNYPVGVEFTVERTEKVTVPAGEFNAYVVKENTKKASKNYWIDNETGILVKKDLGKENITLTNMKGIPD